MNLYQHLLIMGLALIALAVVNAVSECDNPIAYSVAMTIVSATLFGYTIAGIVNAFIFLGTM